MNIVIVSLRLSFLICKKMGKIIIVNKAVVSLSELIQVQYIPRT